MKPLTLFLSLILLTACSLPMAGGSDQSAAATAVAATVQAAQEAAAPPGVSGSGPAGGLVPAGAAQTPVPVGQPQGAQPPPAGAQPPPPAGPQAGQPAAAPGPASNARVTSLNISPAQIYYGKNCTTEPTSLSASAEIAAAENVTQVTLNYAFTGSGGSSPVFSLPMQAGPNGKYHAQAGVGSQAETYLQQAGGRVEVWVDAGLKGGGSIYSDVHQASMTFCSTLSILPGINNPIPPGNAQPIDPALNPALPDNGWVIDPGVNPAPGANPGNASGSVVFSNQTSYPLISLVIDGVEQLPGEGNAINAGSSLSFQVSAGSHTYTAYNGWWQFGSRHEMYRWNGSFTEQQGTITFSNPSIQQLLTGFGNSRYFITGYMGNDMNWHNVGLCFYANGSFKYYDNGTLNDSGTYSEVSRGGQMVTVRLKAATETMDGLYYESFALFDLPNGPGGTVLEYAPSGGCP